MRKQVSIRIDEDFYKEVRIFLLENDTTFQEYVESLIREDMKRKKDLKDKGDDKVDK